MSHIEQLLTIHDCVIIPKVGGFVLQNQAAVWVEHDNLFRPSQKEVVFNQTLRHNDGLLTESYMKTYQADYSQALFMVEKDIAELKTVLFEQGTLSLGTIGSLKSGEEGCVIFEPGETDLFNQASYGLPEFRIRPLEVLLKEKEAAAKPTPAHKKKETIYIPVSVRFVRTAVASAAAIALFLVISTPVKDVNTSAYTASFIPSEVVMNNTVAETEKEEMKAVGSPLPAAVAASEPAPPATAKAKKEAVAFVSAAVPKAKEAPAPKKIKYYHVIIGSFPSQDKAEGFLSGVDSKRYANAGVVERGGKIRVYAARFTTRSDAENYMNKIRNAEYKDAWLFISR